MKGIQLRDLSHSLSLSFLLLICKEELRKMRQKLKRFMSFIMALLIIVSSVSGSAMTAFAASAEANILYYAEKFGGTATYPKYPS